MRRRLLCAQMIALCACLCACGTGSGGASDDELALQIRAELLSSTSITASAEVTADYGVRVYDYGLNLVSTVLGGTTLTVTAPENVAGVQVNVEAGETTLVFDGVSLETGPLDAEGLSPLGALPLLLREASAGFIATLSRETLGETDSLRCEYRAPEQEAGEGRESVLWFDTATHAPLQGEVLSDGKTVISVTFTAFARG